MRLFVSNPRLGQVVAATLVVAGVVGAFFLVHALGTLWLVIFLGVVLATSLAPVVDAAAQRGCPRALAGAAVIGLLGVMVAALLFLVVPAAATQFQALAVKIPVACSRMRSWSDGLAPGMWAEAARRFVAGVCAVTADPIRLKPVLGAGWRYIDALQEGAWILVAVTAIGYFWARDRQGLVRAWLMALPAEKRDGARTFMEEAEKRLGGFVRGQFLLAASIGLLAGIAYKLIGLPHGWTLGLVAAIAEPLPIMGPLMAAAWAATDGVLVDPSMVWKVAIIAVSLRIMADYVLMPAIMGRSSHTNAFLLLVTVVAMASLGGVVGAMVAVPLAALLQLIFEHAFAPARAPDPQALARDRVGVLRYRALQIGEAARKDAGSAARRGTDPSPAGVAAGNASASPVSPGTLEDEIESLAQDLRLWLEDGSDGSGPVAPGHGPGFPVPSTQAPRDPSSYEGRPS